MRRSRARLRRMACFVGRLDQDHERVDDACNVVILLRLRAKFGLGRVIEGRGAGDSRLR